MNPLSLFVKIAIGRKGRPPHSNNNDDPPPGNDSDSDSDTDSDTDSDSDSDTDYDTDSSVDDDNYNNNTIDMPEATYNTHRITGSTIFPSIRLRYSALSDF